MQMKTNWKKFSFLLWVELGDTMRVVKVVRLVPNALASEWKAAFYYVDWGLTCGTAKERARDDADECQNEDGGGATCRLPKTYCSFERVSDCQGGALQHATTRCKTLVFGQNVSFFQFLSILGWRASSQIGREKQNHRKENWSGPPCDTGEEPHFQRTRWSARSNWHQRPES